MATPITLEMVQSGQVAAFSQGVGSQITQGMVDLINSSPRLLGQIQDYSAAVGAAGGQIRPINFDVKPNGAETSGSGTITIGQNLFSNDSQFVGYLAHELGHFENIAQNSAAFASGLGANSSMH